MNAASVISRIAINPGTIAALIRKDLRTLWPFALTLAVLLLVLQTLFRVPADYPNVMLDFGRSQLHLAPVAFLFHTFGLPTVVATFIVMLVHQDPAADARNDWMVRPISALDLVAAKALIILAVVLVPSAIGNFTYAMMHALSLSAATGPIVLTFSLCGLMLVMAWLASSPVQALLAPLVLGVVTVLIVLSLGLTGGVRVVDSDATGEATVEIATPSPEPPQLVLPDAPAAPPAPVAPAAPSPELPDVASPAPSATPPGLQPSIEARQARRLGAQDRTDSVSGSVNLRRIERPQVERPERVIDLTWPIVITEFLLILVADGVVLWLLLVRRRLFAARMTFLGSFGVSILLMLLQGSVSTPRDEMMAFRSIAAPSLGQPAPPESVRFAAFAKHDANGDQKLDKTEYAAVLEELGYSDQLDSLWMQRDDDMDGFVTAQEYRAAIPGVPGRTPAPDPQRFAAFTNNDANNDRRLDMTEYRGVLGELGMADDFDLLWRQRDGNADGFVSAEEYGMPAQ